MKISPILEKEPTLAGKNQELKKFQILNDNDFAIIGSPCNLNFCILFLDFGSLYFFFGSWHLGSWFFVTLAISCIFKPEPTA